MKRNSPRWTTESRYLELNVWYQMEQLVITVWRYSLVPHQSSVRWKITVWKKSIKIASRRFFLRTVFSNDLICSSFLMFCSCVTFDKMPVQFWFKFKEGMFHERCDTMASTQFTIHCSFSNCMLFIMGTNVSNLILFVNPAQSICLVVLWLFTNQLHPIL